MATAAQIESELAELRAAKSRILTSGQELDADGLRNQRARLDQINAEIQRLELQLVTAQSGGTLPRRQAVFR